MDNEKKLTKGKTGGAGEASFRVYYGATGAAVPFKWESQPGTPKHPLSDYSAVPPLTPPPSYLARSSREPDLPWNPSCNRYRKLKTVLLLTRLRRLVRRSSYVSPNSYSSPSLLSSMSSDVSYYSPSTKGRKTRGPQPLVFALMDDDEFGDKRGSSSMRKCFGDSMSSVKNALFSAVGCHRRRSSSSVEYFVQ